MPPAARDAPSRPGDAVQRLGLEKAATFSWGCSARDCPLPCRAGSLPRKDLGFGTGEPRAGELSSLRARLQTPAESPGGDTLCLAPPRGSPSPASPGTALAEGRAASPPPGPAASPRGQGCCAAEGPRREVLLLPSCPPAAFRAASPPSPPMGGLVLCLEKDGTTPAAREDLQVSPAAWPRPRDGALRGCGVGGYPGADGDFLELPGDARHFFPPSAVSSPPAPPRPAGSPRSEQPVSTHTSGSASGDGGSDTHSVSTICGREKALLPGAAAGASGS